MTCFVSSGTWNRNQIDQPAIPVFVSQLHLAVSVQRDHHWYVLARAIIQPQCWVAFCCPLLQMSSDCHSKTLLVLLCRNALTFWLRRNTWREWTEKKTPTITWLNYYFTAIRRQSGYVFGMYLLGKDDTLSVLYVCCNVAYSQRLAAVWVLFVGPLITEMSTDKNQTLV